MRRTFHVAVAICLLSTAGSAQQGLRSASLPDRAPPPLPSATPDVFLARPNTYTPRPPRRDLRRYRGDGFAIDYSHYSDTRFAKRDTSGNVELRIDPGETRNSRSDLDRVASAAPLPQRVVAAGPPKTFYVIPGCYAGDKPPQADRLRPGCRISDTRKVPPVPSVVR